MSPPPSHAVDEFPPPAAADVELYRSMVHQLQPVDDSAADAWPPTQHSNLSTDTEWMGPGVLSMLDQHFHFPQLLHPCLARAAHGKR